MIPHTVCHFSCVTITVRVAQICTSLANFYKHSYNHLGGTSQTTEHILLQMILDTIHRVSIISS